MDLPSLQVDLKSKTSLSYGRWDTGVLNQRTCGLSLRAPQRKGRKVKPYLFANTRTKKWVAERRLPKRDNPSCLKTEYWDGELLADFDNCVEKDTSRRESITKPSALSKAYGGTAPREAWTIIRNPS